MGGAREHDHTSGTGRRHAGRQATADGPSTPDLDARQCAGPSGCDTRCKAIPTSRPSTADHPPVGQVDTPDTHPTTERDSPPTTAEPRRTHDERPAQEQDDQRGPRQDSGGHDRGSGQGHGDGRGHSGGHGHGHGVSAGADRRYLWIAFGLIVAFMLAEVVVGVAVDSLVLLADAGHMVSDAAAIGLALFAMRLATRPATGAYTYGLKRAEILSALANGATLLGLSVFFVIEAVTRLISPPAVSGTPVLVIALVGVVVNLAATLVLRKADRRSMNVEGSFQHILTDLYAFIGTAVAGVVILTTGFVRADAIASLLVAALMVKAGVGLVKESGRVVLEASPRGTDPGAVRSAMLAAPGVLGVHELHVWEVTSGFPALSAHVLVDGHRDCHERRAELENILAARFDIQHTTLQVDHPHNDHPHNEEAAGEHEDDPSCPTYRWPPHSNHDTSQP
jgi:cobalt-zinc-cadmium efflux system protein